MLLLGLFVVVSATTLVVSPLRAERVTTVDLPNGYAIDQVLSGLTFPTAITWDEDGRLYIAEAGYAYGPKEVGPGRIIRVDDAVMPVTSTRTVVVDNLNSPTTDVKFHDGELYVAHRGALSVIRGGVRQDLLTGLPSGDHYTGEIAFDNEGWVYLGNGTVTNSGVVGDDNFRFGWARANPNLHDVPAQGVTLTGRNYDSLDLRTANPTDRTVTGAFSPFGTSTVAGQVVEGSDRPSGAVYRVKTDGSNPQVYAWGLRNPFGLSFAPDGRLIAVDQGYDQRGVRAVANAPDPVYAIEQGGWYGWPDYVAGVPITDPQFATSSEGGPLSLLLKGMPDPIQPLVKLEPHIAAMKFDFAPAAFDATERMYVASFGSEDPVTGPAGSPSGSSILALDLLTGKVDLFARNQNGHPAGRSLTALNRPIDAKFGPDDCLYVVDFGVFEISGQVLNAVPGTGIVWKICKQRTEFGMYAAESVKSLGADGQPWNPDYSALRTELAALTESLGNEWGIYFKDLQSGVTFGVNPEVRVPAASTVKVPVVLYASTLAEKGKLDLNERMEYLSDRDWRGGAGSMQYTASDGDTFALRELMEKAIRESDNVAWKMLERRLGKSNIADFMTGLGGKVVYPYGENVSTPRDLAVYVEAALNFAKESDFGDKLMYDLTHTIWNTGLNRYIEEVQVAHKEGDITGVADDVGVIYADHPYILSIMSQGHDDVELGFEQIGQISRRVFDYQAGLGK